MSSPCKAHAGDNVHVSPSRRGFLAAALTGAALTLAPVQFAAADAGSTRIKTITGHLDAGAADFVYLPVEVPAGVNKISVSYSYSKPSVPGGFLNNACDIGVFDEKGTKLAGKGFRGWSGGFRTEFFISAADATPGYLPGRVGKGTWNIVLGPYQVAEQGMDYTVNVTLDYGPDGAAHRPQYPAQEIAGRGAGWYRGDAHLHTIYSDGKRTPADVAAGARAAKLDFMISTDHNTPASHGAWGPLAGDDLLILTGEEVTTRNGHYLALGIEPGQWIDWRYRARDKGFKQEAQRIRSSGGIVVPAHPYCPYVACRWKFGYDEADAVEVWTGPWTADDEYAINTWDSMLAQSTRDGGRWLPAMGNSDAHSAPQVIGFPHNVVNAKALSRDAILEGIRKGRSWIAESAGVSLEFSIASGDRSAGIGERLTAAANAPVTVTAAVSGVPNGLVRLITDEGQMRQASLSADGQGTVSWVTTPQLTAYVRVEVRHPMADGSPSNGTDMGTTLKLGPMAALSNPIFLDMK
ncbi:CehA/McbA family metallohydrolase [Arthrobacter sp. HY1533]|uniref:CehA/McbA family metallohydrolase n=1 Tax=Arthrobacter sp. HY1533 TaxID=2970919 RepID=UPI0022B9DFFC|nr:CehA/McbA family metallohydrolase [Arthrobacter sp. HY1533]